MERGEGRRRRRRPFFRELVLLLLGDVKSRNCIKKCNMIFILKRLAVVQKRMRVPSSFLRLRTCAGVHTVGCGTPTVITSTNRVPTVHTHTQNQQGSGQIQPTPHPMGCICCPDKNNTLSKTRDNIHSGLFLFTTCGTTV